MYCLHCYALIHDEEKRNQLKMRLQHHRTLFREGYHTIYVNTTLQSRQSVEVLIKYFEDTEAAERGITIITENEEADYEQADKSE